MRKSPFFCCHQVIQYVTHRVLPIHVSAGRSLSAGSMFGAPRASKCSGNSHMRGEDSNPVTIPEQGADDVIMFGDKFQELSEDKK